MRVVAIERACRPSAFALHSRWPKCPLRRLGLGRPKSALVGKLRFMAAQAWQCADLDQIEHRGLTELKVDILDESNCWLRRRETIGMRAVTLGRKGEDGSFTKLTTSVRFRPCGGGFFLQFQFLDHSGSQDPAKSLMGSTAAVGRQHCSNHKARILGC
jgi:hypothetical protein